MSVQYVTGDLFEQQVSALAHGVNCAGAMGRGIAVEFKRRWPDMYKGYYRACARSDLRPGDIMPWIDRDSGRVIYNMATQASWRTKATLDAIEQSLVAMLRHAPAAGVDQIAMPRIGCGLGGLEWKDVKAVIERVSSGYKTKLIVVTLDEGNDRILEPADGPSSPLTSSAKR